MDGMTVQARLEDISRRAGVSTDVVRRVLNAETASVTESLEHGERATLIGRVTLRPELRTRLAIGGTLTQYVKVSATVASQLADHMEEIHEFTGHGPDAVVEEARTKMVGLGDSLFGIKTGGIIRDNVLG